MKHPPLSLYVHLPWCVRKCPYCDFNSHTAGDAAPKQRYINALLCDLERESVRAEGRTLESIFLGGGTPSLFSPDEIGHVLEAVETRFSVAADVEVTMEANPGTVECGSLAGYRNAGVTRLSVGAQSFNDVLLKTLGRIHSSADISRAVRDAQDGGFENINIDLMHGLPGQTIEAAMADLDSAVDLNPAHISWYELTLEPNTVFFARPPPNLPDGEMAAEIQDRGMALLARRGYERYEISAFAKDDRLCRHNLNYWLFGDYLAVGAGAHGKLTTGNAVYRYQKPANPLQYMKTQEAGDTGEVPAALQRADLIFEFMLNALRLSAGFAEETFCQRTGLSTSDLMSATAGARARGLIERLKGGLWLPTKLGGRFLNDLQAEFLPDKA